jgi:hypothetical protein
VQVTPIAHGALVIVELEQGETHRPDDQGACASSHRRRRRAGLPFRFEIPSWT